PGTDNQPTWVGDTIYFTSDRNYTMNLFAISPEGGEPRQVTGFTDFDVLWPSAGKDAIVFENGGAIWRFDPKTSKASEVPIRVTGDFPQTLPTWKNVAANVESFDLDEDAGTIAFAARGEVFRYSGKDPEIRNLSRTPDARELGLTMAPDGNSIAFLSDASGEYELYLQSLAGGAPKRLTRDGDVWRFPPVYSPDGRHIAYADKKQRLRIVNVDSGTTRDVDNGRAEDITEYVWSPDGQWLAYTLRNSGGLARVWLYSLADGSKTPVTADTSSAFSPAFDPEGRWLYFLSDRDYQLQFSAYEMNYLYADATRVYAVSLSADGPYFYRDQEDADAKDADKSDKDASTKRLKIDTKGMSGREQVLKAGNGNYRKLQASADAVFFAASPGGRDDGKFELRMLDLDADKDVVIAKGLSDYALAANGKQVLVQFEDKFALLDTKADQDPAKNALDLSAMKLLIDPQREWNQEFTDGWRILRDWFYDPGMHGGIERWNTIRARYQPLVAHAATRQDLDYIFQELVGELQAGHIYVQQGD
ncbi:S41 family peptidase, partial [Dokdonella sp.]|uniref:S41 family peptidase n=1 Tax=Dokdonella sp. TaxID=2291710 RepID=UPI003C41DC15